MKKIPIILTLDFLILLLTPFGYLVLMPGIVLHVLLGIFQLVIFGYLLWELKGLSRLIHKLLAIYSIALIIIIGCALIDLDSYGIFSWIGSYLLALFFTVILVIVNNSTSKIKQL